MYDYDEDGELIGSHIEIYYEWDEIGKKSEILDSFTFLGKEFYSSKFYISHLSNRSSNFKTSHNYRHYYNYVLKEQKILFTGILKDNNVFSIKGYSENLFVESNKTIDEKIRELENSENSSLVAFWVLWIILICVIIGVFYYVENNWLHRGYKHDF